MAKIKIQIIINLIITLIPYIICDINIHIIPHTHLDPGWLKTPEDYYRKEKVNYIFDTILSELSKSKDKTFVINESTLFLDMRPIVIGIAKGTANNRVRKKTSSDVQEPLSIAIIIFTYRSEIKAVS